MTLVLGNQVQIWLARCFTSGDVFDFISLTTFQPKFFRDLWTFIVGTGLAESPCRLSFLTFRELSRRRHDLDESNSFRLYLNSQFTLFLERHAMLLSSFYASIRKVFAARADFITQVLWVPIVTLPSFRRKPESRFGGCCQTLVLV